MNNLEKFLHITSWILIAFLLILPLWLAGLILVPYAISRDEWPWWLRWYDNDEEDVPDWWFARAKEKGGFIARFPNFWWYHVRNPLNNTRYLFEDREAEFFGSWPHKEMEPHMLDVAGNNGNPKFVRWAKGGMFAGRRTVELIGNGEYKETWYGWKVGSDIEGMGFTFQNRTSEIGD